MTVSRLIELLEKVEHKEMEVVMRTNEEPDASVDFVLIEHQLTDDSMALILEGVS